MQQRLDALVSGWHDIFYAQKVLERRRDLQHSLEKLNQEIEGVEYALREMSILTPANNKKRKTEDLKRAQDTRVKLAIEIGEQKSRIELFEGVLRLFSQNRAKRDEK